MLKTLLLIAVYCTIPSKDPDSAPRVHHANQRPVVQILAPLNDNTFSLHTPIHYSIHVSDKEDGDSRYDEINPNEVLLEVRSMPNQSALQKALHSPLADDPSGLSVLRTSNCFNCHGFHAKLIGPSFLDIDRRYTPTPANAKLLIESIANGSTGVWGNVPMPKHPELTREQIRDIVHWMLLLKTQRDTDYYVGLEGTMRLDSVAASSSAGLYLLTASYIDHGTPNAGSRLKGQQAILIHGK